MKRKMPTVCLFKQVVVDLDVDGMGFLLSKWWPKPIKWRRPIKVLWFMWPLMSSLQPPTVNTYVYCQRASSSIVNITRA